jgi:serine/threonine-protein kinase
MVALSKRPEQRFPSMRAFSDATGATALRGDATAIIQSHTRLDPGRTTHDIQKRAPLHTVALALARSRAAAIARRFKGLHPAVQGVSIGVFAVAAVGALLLLFHSETSPLQVNTTPIPSSEQGQVREGQFKAPSIDPMKPSSNSTRTESAPLNRSPAEKSCNSNFPGSCVTTDPSDLPKGQQLQPAEKKPALQPEGSNIPDGDKSALANFKAAYDQANYQDAFNIAQKLYAAGDPAGAYGEGVLYVHGYGGVQEEPARARNLFYEAATAKNALPMAMVKLGVMYHDGKGGEQNKRLARTWFEKAADLGDGEAMFNLGQMSWLNEAGLKHRDAVDFYRKARDAGYLPAKQRLEELGAGE